MVSKPPVVNQHGLTNTNGGGWTTPYLAIVLHIAGGSLAGADSWFNDPAARTRVNYMVGWSGTIHEYYDPADVRGYQHGIVQGATSEKFKALSRLAGGANPNLWAVGIEHEDFQQGNVARQFGEHIPMFEASTSLSAWLCDHFGIPPVAERFLCHAEIDAINRVCCPMCPEGREQMVERYVARVREKLGLAPDTGDDVIDLNMKVPIFGIPEEDTPTLNEILHGAYYASVGVDNKLKQLEDRLKAHMDSNVGVNEKALRRILAEALKDAGAALE